jgi:hypothetical protein
VIKGFDKAVTGLSVGEKNKIRCEGDEAYGEWREELCVTVPKDVRSLHPLAHTSGALGTAAGYSLHIGWEICSLGYFTFGRNRGRDVGGEFSALGRVIISAKGYSHFIA